MELMQSVEDLTIDSDSKYNIFPQRLTLPAQVSDLRDVAGALSAQ